MMQILMSYMLLAGFITVIDSTCTAGEFQIETTYNNQPHCKDASHNYVVISKNIEGTFHQNNSIISLLEVDLFEGASELAENSLTFTMSSEYWSSSSASNCNDGKYGEDSDMCQTAPYDTNPFLIIDAGEQNFDRINVTNRVDCCQQSINEVVLKVYHHTAQLQNIDIGNMGLSLGFYELFHIGGVVPTSTPTMTPTSLPSNLPSQIPTFQPITEYSPLYGEAMGKFSRVLYIMGHSFIHTEPAQPFLRNATAIYRPAQRRTHQPNISLSYIPRASLNPPPRTNTRRTSIRPTQN